MEVDFGELTLDAFMPVPPLPPSEPNELDF